MAIRSNNDLYEWMVALLLREAAALPDEQLLKRVEDVAELAFRSGPQLLADPRLDELVLGVARRLEPGTLPPRAPLAHRPRRVLHVTTDLHHVGGHTRIILNWIQVDPGTCYDLISTNQCGVITDWMRETLQAAGVKLTCQTAATPRLERARALRRLVIEGGYDLVVLHHYPWDMVALVALGVEELPQVFVFNQGDHVFWLGTPLADAVLDFRRSGAEVTRRVRGVPRSLHLPYILEPQSPNADRAEAKSKAGLGEWGTVMVSMARIQKFVPCQGYNLHRTFEPIMRRHPEAVLLLIGVKPAEYRALFGAEPPPNLKPLGNVPQPAQLLRAADIFIEPMPWGTALATFDVCRHGAVPVFVHGLAPCIYGCAVRDLFEGSGVDHATATEAEYVEWIERLLTDAPHREALGRKAAAYCAGDFLAPQWNEHLDRVWEAAVGGRHAIRSSGPVRYEDSAAFAHYGRCLSEDLAAHVAWCMNRLGITRPGPAVRLAAAFCRLRLTRPAPQGVGACARFLVNSARAALAPPADSRRCHA